MDLNDSLTLPDDQMWSRRVEGHQTSDERRPASRLPRRAQAGSLGSALPSHQRGAHPLAAPAAGTATDPASQMGLR